MTQMPTSEPYERDPGSAGDSPEVTVEAVLAAAEQRLGRFLDDDDTQEWDRDDTDDTDSRAMVQSAMLAAARHDAQRIIGEAHRRADEIVHAARTRARQHTDRAMDEATSTVLGATNAPAALAPAVASLLGEGLRATQPHTAGDGSDAVAAADASTCPDVVRRWASMIRRVAGPMAPSHTELCGLLSALWQRLLVAGQDPAASEDGGERVGQDLIRAGLSDPAMLGATMEALIEALVEQRRGSDGLAVHHVAAVAAVATGFAEQLRSLVRDQQHEIQRAVRSATQQIELSLRTVHMSAHRDVALFDPLTGLPNRVMLIERLDAARARPGPGRVLGMCVIDIAGFKNVNDTYGAPIGDRVLARLARRLCALVGEDHCVARLGSDEFAILIEDCAGRDHLREIADSVLAAIGEPVSLEPGHLSMAGRLGLADAPAGAASAARLVRQAEIALRRAQRTDTPVAWFAADIDLPKVRAGTSRPSIEAHDFTLRYHKVVSLADGRIRALEGRVSYQHPHLQSLDVDQVIDLTDDLSWLSGLYEHVLREACQHAMHWPEVSGAAPILTMRLPAAQLSVRQVCNHIDAALTETRLAPARFTVEIPERFVTTSIDNALHLTAALHARGIGIAIGDVGTGYTTLAYLRHIPVSHLILCPKLVTDLDQPTTPPTANAVLTAMVSLAHSLGVDVIARGVDTPRRYERLTALGVDLAQGRHLGAALSDATVNKALHHPDTVITRAS